MPTTSITPSSTTPRTYGASISQAELTAALDSALRRVPPLWPLRHFVAVNPFVGLTDRTFPEACTLLKRTVGGAPVQGASDYRLAYEQGSIERADLNEASDAEITLEELLRAIQDETSEDVPATLATVADLLDQERPRAHWSQFVVDEVSKWCSVAFDENQTTWNLPRKTQGLYSAWKGSAAHDLNPEAFGLVGFRSLVSSLPSSATEAIASCLEILELTSTDLADLIHRELATVAGWAGYVQYVVREDALRGRANPALEELLAIRLAYDAALYRAFGREGALRSVWLTQGGCPRVARRFDVLARWQFAYEAGYQRRLARALSSTQAPAVARRPAAQAVFCIDVRSEVFRRHLEAALPGVQTIGFAGFFGFPVAHRHAGDTTAAALCPVLLVPQVSTGEDLSSAQEDSAIATRAEAGAWKAFQNSAASCFSFVESAGLAFGAALSGAGRANRLSCSHVKPRFESAPIEARASLSANALRNMGLTKNFARVVLICGHGSQSANNPYASGLDCGACGGNAGDVNARIAASTLNEPAIRSLLSQQGMVIPPDTFFLAGLHNTTTDDVVLFNLDSVPESHAADLADLRRGLALAGSASRLERAATLGLAGLPNDSIDAAVRKRAIDIAQVRPEWGLANNAALVAAPRSRTSGLNLNGRVFLHDYDCSADPDNKILTLILCAPVVVASWINLQYYASRVDPLHFGAGDKVLHNVVGGIGVLEGNGGDLKVGLPRQSIHDGEHFVHEPRRLAVYIEAAPASISSVLEEQPSVRQLFDHGWLHLFALQGTSCQRYRNGAWVEI